MTSKQGTTDLLTGCFKIYVAVLSILSEHFSFPSMRFVVFFYRNLLMGSM